MKLNSLPSLQTLLSLVILVITQQLIRATIAHVSSSVDDYMVGEETDHKALLAIKNRLIDRPTDGALSSWNRTLHHCSWEGVTCVPKNNRVIELNLAARGLGGTISPYIGNLTFLRSISLENNSLSGQIPLEIGQLLSVQSLHLDNNTLSGKIPPTLSRCINLEHLSLASNHLRGELPMGLGALSNLKFLSVRSNQLSGPLFKAIANLTSLKSLDGSFNSFTGTIPHDISRMMRGLTFLNLDINKLSGTIPPSIFNLSSLRLLRLGSNHLEGHIPSTIGFTLPRLQHLSLFENHLSGTLPTSIQNLTHLRSFDVGGNNFTGRVLINFGYLHNLQRLNLDTNNFIGNINSIISPLVNCTSLEMLELRTNQFTGIIPKVMPNLSLSLVTFSIGANRISGGIIPRGIGKLINLRDLSMTECNLVGTIPQELGKLRMLENLNLYSNKLSGEIPNSFQNLSHLSKLILYKNNLQGSIPSSLGRCESLLTLYLGDNNFKGTIPRELFEGSAKFITLDLSKNQLEGFIPNEISEQYNLEYLDVSRNKLLGEIPSFLGNLFSLNTLCMNHNFFHGSIPTSFASLRSLMSIDLSQNSLSGPIPKYFSAFPLTYLNLSYNNFEGIVPTKGVLAYANVTNLVGNSRLCGGVPELHLPRCSVPKNGNPLMVLILIICAFVGVLAMAMTFMSLCLQYHKKKIRHVLSSSSILLGEQFLNVSYDMLLKATNGFSQKNLLGSGTFGFVYKGVLDGDTVAVKVLNLEHRGGSKSFMAECKALRNVRHRNLVRIITACSSTDFQRNDFKALVYEFMTNESLERWLHGDKGDISLFRRVDIAIDVAHALNYLHNECDNTIVHRDIKPSNILLDDDMVAYVADLGLAKVLSQPLQPNQSSSIGVSGTIGYAAPEYGMGGEAKIEADLYSYGILLLELMTRIRPSDDLFEEDFNLHMYAKAALPDQVLQIVDENLREDDHEMEEDDDGMSMEPRTPIRVQRREKCIKIVVEVGVACSEQSPHNRMKISEALSQLQHARNMILYNPRNKHSLARGKTCDIP